MVAQRTATPTRARARQRRTAIQRPAQHPAANQQKSDDDDAGVCKLLRLQAMRTDALVWVASIERRIEDMEHTRDSDR